MSKIPKQANESTTPPVTNRKQGDKRKRNKPSYHCGALLSMLHSEARRRDITNIEMAEEIGVSYGYINQLSNGTRSVDQISRKFVLSVSQFLYISPIAVQLAAGQISIGDFSTPEVSTETAVDIAIGRILDDPKIRQGLSSKLLALPLTSKIAVIEVYMQTTGKDLIELRDSPVVLNKIKAMLEIGHHGTSNQKLDPMV
jgi:transcriptional regulator with XRE-family HTH domain